MTPTMNPAFHVMAKPSGPLCNLDCRYCFYTEKTRLFPSGTRYRMSPAVLETYIRDYIRSQPGERVTFAWQGGEPTLLGVDFFRDVVALQRRYADGRPIDNALQTNGTLLDDEWGAFFKEEGFLIGISIDGPRFCHDTYRVNRGGQPTYDRVMRGLAVLKKHAVEFNTLTVVNDVNAKRPLEVYEFLKSTGSGYIQFIPLVERWSASGCGSALAASPQSEKEGEVTAWSVSPEAYGTFLTTIFDAWVKRDVGRVFVQMFDVTLGNWVGAGPGLCVFAEECGSAMALEHNGDLYACDHYVYPEYRLGNLMKEPLAQLASSERQTTFGREKKTRLPAYCRECPVLFACNGGCPKHRFANTPAGEPGLNYFCPAYRTFFEHVRPAMDVMTALLRSQRPPAEIMRMKKHDRRAWIETA